MREACLQKQAFFYGEELPSLFERESMKEKIYNHCLQLVNEKLAALEQAYRESREALESEAKNTAGDKHETGRAMIQLEQEKMSRQLQETQKLKSMLQRVPYDKVHQRVESGALVECSEGRFFIAVGLGRLEIDDKEVFVVAPFSPLAQAMLGKQKGEAFGFWNQSVVISTIC